MNVMSVDKAARASSCDGGEDGECPPMLGLVFAVIGLMVVDGGAMDKGLRFAVLVRECWSVLALKGDTCISSCGESRWHMPSEVGKCLDVAESGDDSAPIKGTVCRRRKELAGAKGGRRAIFEAGREGLGPQLDNGEKKGELGLLKSLVNDRSE